MCLECYRRGSTVLTLTNRIEVVGPGQICKHLREKPVLLVTGSAGARNIASLT